MQGQAAGTGAVARRIALIAAGALASATATATAQDAVVLSGGGSRGLAHAGALAGIEARGYSPEIVVGTSMGAVIGALYAAGYSPDSIRALILAEDWRAVFTRGAWLLGPDRSPMRPLLETHIGDGALASATGLIDDLRLNRRLVQLLLDASVRAHGDFDRLPRRFRAVSGDFGDGSVIAPTHGDVILATRASLAIPGVFAPVVMGNTALVDGGIVSYLPVGVARSIGAGRIIAVDVLRPPQAIESLGPLALATRAFRLTLGNTLRDPPDYLIVPDIAQSMSAAVFPLRPGRLMRAGEFAALATLPQAAAPVLRRSGTTGASAPRHFTRLVVESGDVRLIELVQLAFRGATGAYDREHVLRAADRLYATGLFRGVWPRLDVQAGDTVLVVRVDPVPPTRLGMWAAWDADVRGLVMLALRHRPGRGALDLAFAGAAGHLERGASAEAKLTPRSRPIVALNAGAAWTQRDVRIFLDDDIVAEPAVSRGAGWVGLEWRGIAPELHLSLGLRGEVVESDAFLDSDADGTTWGPSLRFGATASAPRIVGMPFALEADARFGEIRYRHVRAGGSLDGSAGRLLLSAAAEARFARGEPPLDVFPALGDDHAVPGLRWGQERARTTVVAGVDLAYPIPFDGFVRLRSRAGFAGLSLVDWQDEDQWTCGVGLAGLWYTPIGGMLLGGAISGRGNWRIDFAIGGVPAR